MIAIGVNNLGKKFKLYTSPAGRFLEYFTLGKMTRHSDFWALQGISFEIPSGTTLGILGQNGSGKSTLLSILAGVLEQSAGSFQINGKVSAILELGSGFHPEFSGRDNVYMYGSIMGLSRQEVDERFDDIARFSELGDFIDQPLRTYSSGMTVRLAFSVAVNVNADILIVDEALAVGDAIFQHRCFRKIREMQEAGKTILYVGHDTEAVRNLCNQAILLDGGRIIEQGDPNTVVSRYYALITERERNYNEETQIEHGISPANDVKTVFNFVNNLDAAEIDTPDPANVNERVIHIQETPRKIIFAHPPSRITYTLTTDPESSLSFAIGLLPESFNKMTQGVKFDIEISSDEVRENIFSRLLQPQRNIGDKGWHNFVIPLKKYGGKKVAISFITTGSSEDIRYCWAAWGWPKLVTDDNNTIFSSSDPVTQEPDQGTSEPMRYGSRKAEIIKVRILDESGIPRLSFKSGEKTQIDVEVRLLTPDIAGAVSVAFYIKDKYTTVYGRDTWNYGLRFENQSQGNIIRVKFEQNLILGAGIYSITASVSEVYARHNFDVMDRLVDYLTIKVESGEKFLTGCVDLDSVVQIFD